MDRNCERTKIARATYCDWFLENLHSYQSVIYVDESGFNLWTKRNNGRSPKGQPAIRTVCSSKGKNLSLILAISPRLGRLGHTFTNGSVTGDIFAEYMLNLSNSLPSDEKYLIVLDNASVHKSVSLDNLNHQLKFLPPYSPMLNPIEEAFSAWKAVVKRELALPDTIARINDNSAAFAMGSNLADYHRGILQQIGHSSLSNLTIKKIVNWHNHSLSFCVRCQNKESL